MVYPYSAKPRVAIRGLTTSYLHPINISSAIFYMRDRSRIGKSMSVFSIIIALVLIASAVSQGILAVVFVAAILHHRQGMSHTYSSRTAIVLCLRRTDPFLGEVLESLLEQDYPDYQLHVVVDNRQDPAWQVAQSLADRYGADRVCIEALDERQDTCSLKCSAGRRQSTLGRVVSSGGPGRRRRNAAPLLAWRTDSSPGR